MSVPPAAAAAALDVLMSSVPLEASLEAAEPHIRADERARIRSLLPYNVNCCDGFGAAVADLIGEHGDAQ